MLSSKISKSIASLFYFLDQAVRNDLYEEKLADERDCVSRLVTHFSYPFGIFNKFKFNSVQFKSQWVARVNKGTDEQKFGCDAMIVFQTKEVAKVALFEAKWPRLLDDPSYNWDYLQKASKISHFTSQIERQSNWSKNAAIWEMFFYEGKVGVKSDPYDDFGSTCIKHEFALNYINGSNRPTTIWDNDDLKQLILSSHNPDKYKSNLEYMIEKLLDCNYGNPIEVGPKDRVINFYHNDGIQWVNVPVIKFPEDSQGTYRGEFVTNAATDERVDSFMAENGLSFFQYIKIDDSSEGDNE